MMVELLEEQKSEITVIVKWKQIYALKRYIMKSKSE